MFMFINSKQLVPIAVRMLFARNDQYHNYNITQSRSLYPSVGRGKAIYSSFSFHGVNIWNYLSKHIPTNVSYNRINKLTKSYLLNNNIIIVLYMTIAIQYVYVLFYYECCPHILGTFFYFCLLL